MRKHFNSFINYIKVKVTGLNSWINSNILLKKIMTRPIEFTFINIPIESTILIVDNYDRSRDYNHEITVGNSTLIFELPDNWSNPYYKILTTKYYIPNSTIKIESSDNNFEITGNEFYADLDREKLNEELNQIDVESLIHRVSAIVQISGRQKFYISLNALQSYFEYLTFAMLVRSGKIGRNAFRALGNHENQTIAAFDSGNTSFFTDNIIITPGKASAGTNIAIEFRDEIKNIFTEVRKLRNRVIHGWGDKDVDRQKLSDIFSNMNLVLQITGDDETFYTSATQLLVTLYAKTGTFRNQASIFNEKFVVESERRKRGY